MKKTFFALACAFAIAFGMTSCDEEDLQSIVDDVTRDLEKSMGQVDLAVSNAQGDSPYATNDSVHFTACVNGVVTDTVDFSGLDDSLTGFQGANTFIMGANISLTDTTGAGIDITNVYPIFGLKTADTLPGIHIIHSPFQDTNLLHDFNFGKLITQGSYENLMGIAMSDTSWYVGYEGNVNINTYPEPGKEMKATLNAVKAYYVTQSKLDYIGDLSRVVEAADPYDYLRNMTQEERIQALSDMTEDQRNEILNILTAADNAKRDLDSIVDNPGILFSSLIFNGTLKSRRTDVQGFVDQLNVEEE